jgi:hypothetical protein
MPERNALAPQSKTSSPRLAPRDARCVVGGIRAWGENPGRRASSSATVLPFRAFTPADIKKTASDFSIGIGGVRFSHGRRPPRTVTASESLSQTATRADCKSRVAGSETSRSPNADGFLKVPLTTREDLRPLPLSPELASLLMGPLVALSDLLTKFVEGRRRCRPSRAWFLDLLRHRAVLLIAPLGRLATGRMQSAAPRRWTLPLTLYSAACGSSIGRRRSGRAGRNHQR